MNLFISILITLARSQANLNQYFSNSGSKPVNVVESLNNNGIQVPATQAPNNRQISQSSQGSQQEQQSQQKGQNSQNHNENQNNQQNDNNGQNNNQNQQNDQNHQNDQNLQNDQNQQHEYDQASPGSEMSGELFNMTEYLRNVQMMPPEDVLASPIDPESIEVTWKIPTNLRRDRLRFQIILKYFNARQTEAMATELPINQLFLANDEETSMEERIVGRFTMKNLTRNIEYRLSLRTKITTLINDPEKPGLKKEVYEESSQSEWKKVYTSAKIFSGDFNFTQIVYDNYLTDHKDEKTVKLDSDVKDIIKRTVLEIDQNFLSSGNIKYTRSNKNRTMVNANLYFKLDSSTKIADLNSRIRHVWPAGMNHGLDFHSIDVKDFNECGTHWDDCNRRAECHNMEGMFSCRCDEGYYDGSRKMLKI